VSDQAEDAPALRGVRRWLYVVIFEHHTRAGKAFDVGLFVLIVVSVSVVMLESVMALRAQYARLFWQAEWLLTAIFSLEYLLRLACLRRPARYALSFFGVVDLLAILPAYVALFVSGTHYLVIVRVLRLLRVFRVFKLARHLTEADVLLRALLASRAKIFVFMCAVASAVVVIGATMYVVEGETNGFTSIPRSIYWAIVTLTTVGYGDIAPRTVLGQFLASLVMILGYGVIAVPTGIVSLELQQAVRAQRSASCIGCKLGDHAQDAVFCRRCGTRLP